jgi:hypothetical protein
MRESNEIIGERGVGSCGQCELTLLAETDDTNGNG